MDKGHKICIALIIFVVCITLSIIVGEVPGSGTLKKTLSIIDAALAVAGITAMAYVLCSAVQKVEQ